MKSPISLSVLFVAVVCLAGSAGDVHAQVRGRPGGGTVVGHAVARPVAPVVASPRVIAVRPFAPYFYPYWPGISVGFGFGYPYGYPYYYGYPWGYPYYGYGYGYGYPAAPTGYSGYGGVRIEEAPKRAQVFADGYYAGVVDDFDGTFQHLNLPAGVHQIEIRQPNQPPISFEVNVQPGQTINYHAGIRH